MTSNVASLPEFTKNAAVLVDPLDVEDISDGNEAVLRDDQLRYELIEKGLARSREYTWDRSVNHIVNICKELKNSEKNV